MFSFLKFYSIPAKLKKNNFNEKMNMIGQDKASKHI